MLVTSKSVGATAFFEKVRSRCARAGRLQVFARVRPHSPIEDVEECTSIARTIEANLLVSVGGGSSIDTTKGVVRDFLDRGAGPPFHVALPTTLSGAEFSKDLGLSVGKGKTVFSDVRFIPNVVIMDPEAALTAPVDLILPSGMNSIARCVEGIASIRGNAVAEGLYLHAIRLLSSALKGIKQDPRAPVERSRAQAGAMLAIVSGDVAPPKGIEFALAHVVGGFFKVPHALAHSILIAPCMRFNAPLAYEWHAMIAEALGVPGVDSISPREAARSASDAVVDLLKELGIPTRLRDVGVKKEMLPEGAVMALHDPYYSTNLIPLNGEQDVLRILEDAW
jgi:alcohol dehydrogenase class IV